MVSRPLNHVLRLLRRAALQGEAHGVTDRQLLERFLATREEAAFEALVRRHGSMVLGVCRRVLDHLQDAEDAYQATFLVLACKASSILQRETVANWLYGVAYRTAQKARAAAARRRVKEKHMARPEAFDEASWQDLSPLIDQELSSLPDKYREPLVLCDLQGVTRKAAAHQLGWSEGTLSGRLSRARELLAKRLARHGVTLTGVAVAAALSSSEALACVPAPLILSTVQAATLIAAGKAVAGVASASVAALTKGVLKAMFMTKLKTGSAVLLAVGLLAIGAASSLPQPPGAPIAQAPGAGAAPAPQAGAPPGVAPAKLPKGMPPFQVLVSLTADGKLTVKSNAMGFKVTAFAGGGGAGGAGGGRPGGPGGGGGGFGGAGFGVNNSDAIQTQTYEIKDVQVFDTKGKQLDNKDLAKLVKEETVAMATWGQGVDPMHLRVLKDGILTFVLPAPQGVGPGLRPGGGAGKNGFGGGGGGGGFPGGAPGGDAAPGGGGPAGGAAPRP
jgi:RNA polymerase sigma factor (sigma-70 family)